MKDVSGNMLSFSEQILAEKTKSEIGGLGRIGYSFNHDFYVLASVLGIKYFYQRCECGLRSKVADHHHASLVVDLAKLEKNLQLMLAQ